MFKRFLAIFFLIPALNHAEELKLSDYLKQVEEAHEGLQATKLRISAYKNEAAERSLLLSPSLIGQAHFLLDKKDTGATVFLGDKTTAEQYSLGVSQLTTIGFKGQIRYEIDHTRIEGVDPNLFPVPDYYEGKPVLEISQSLWRNFFGAETRAQLNAIEAKALASSFSESFKAKQIRASAEMVYWKTRIAQKTVEVRKDSLDRAVQLREWTKRRVSLQLADRSDLLQSESALKARTLELRHAEDDLKDIARNFNSLRGRNADEISDEFEKVDFSFLKNLKIPDRAPFRDDVLAAEQANRLTQSAAQLTYEKGRPSLDATASIALNARNTQASDTIQKAFDTDHPTYSVGVMLNAPLGWFSAKSLREGAEAEKNAANLEYKRKIFEQEQEWKILEHDFLAAQDRLKLVVDLEASEQEKVRHERDRLRKGRTTTYQVLLFEQDYETSKLNRLLSENEVLTLLAQLKTFQ